MPYLCTPSNSGAPTAWHHFIRYLTQRGKVCENIGMKGNHGKVQKKRDTLLRELGKHSRTKPLGRLHESNITARQKMHGDPAEHPHIQKPRRGHVASVPSRWDGWTCAAL